jgi:hemerythrin-like domain-containing protein
MKPVTSAAQVIRDRHRALAAVLRSLQPLIDEGTGDNPERFFDILRAMLFYIDEFPEQRHHPKESHLLFPMLARVAPELRPVIQRLESDHMDGEARVRALQHKLLAWELIGESRREAFAAAVKEYVQLYLEHMRVKETQLLPVAERVLTTKDWDELGRAFEAGRDPFTAGERDPIYDRLFTRIVLAAPAPIGVGPVLAGRRERDAKGALHVAQVR